MKLRLLTRTTALFFWLLALAGPGWTLLSAPNDTAGVRVTALSPPRGQAGFTLLSAAQTGVTFTNRLDPWAGARNRVLNAGSGVAAGDFDNDGRVDLFFCSLNQGNRLFRNLGGLKFQDVTEEAGLKFPPLYFRAAVFADLNGDGWLDLLVGSASQGVFCYLNDQHGHFKDATQEAGTASPLANETLALADIDGNGTLDLYVCNNRNDDIRDRPRVPVVMVNRKPTVTPELRGRIFFEGGVMQEVGEPDILYLNDGLAHFRNVAWTNGAWYDARTEVLTNTPLDWGLAATFRDLNNDGAPDLYVCNDYWTPDRLWINGGRGKFREVDTLSLRKIPFSSMGVAIGDINRDGHLDIFAVDMLSRSSELRRRQMVAKRPIPPRVGETESRLQTPHNTLLLNRGDGTFAEIAAFAGVEASDWSWSPAFLDVDLDGYEDLLITTGHIRDIQDLDANDRVRAQQESWRSTPLAATNLPRAFLEARREHAQFYPPLDMPVVAFHNLGGTLRFEETTTHWGLNVPGVNHGMALADLDNDGDLDLVVNRLGAPAAIFRNDCPAPRVAVRLRGRPPNTQAIGARIELLGGAVTNQINEVTSGGSYMSGSDTLRVFASGPAQSGLRLKVTWRDGSTTDLAGIEPNHLYDLDENVVTRTPKGPAAGTAPGSRPPPEEATWFEDVSALLNHTHHEESFDDFARQPTLPRKLSQGGPGVAWFDLNGDGWEDLIIASGRGGQMAVLLNQEGKAFSPDTNAAFSGAVPRDQTTVLGWSRAAGEPSILAGSASYEDGEATSPAAHAYDLKTGAMQPALPGLPASVGPLALGDTDGGGQLKLFAGGQVVPGQYPVPAASQLFHQVNGRWTLDAENSRMLAQAGLVNGAVWSDLDGDGLPELVLACEWGPIRVFHNRGGKLTDATAAWGLSPFTGLWQSVTAGDFDGDGRLDLVAGNWGENNTWRANPAKPLTLYYGDLSGRNGVDVVETEYDSTSGRLVPRHLRDTVAAAIPWIAERFPTHLSWSRATMAEVLADRRTPTHALTASTLATTVFLNRGGKLEAHPLPALAQLAPTFGLAVADFDGDGREDLFLAQNFFAFRTEDERQDASQGLLLAGDGQGGFTPVPGRLSGIRVHGEQRGAAVADFDQDGRTDLVVTQNGAATRLLRNKGARPGLRVRVTGEQGVPGGIGVVLRVKSARGVGPAREIHAGSGYWSQDSTVAVLATPETPESVLVTWPGGRHSEVPVPANTSEITVKP